MSLSNPKSIFGVHSFTPYSRTDGTFYGVVKVLASSTLTFSGATVSLMGGSSKYPWAVEEGAISSQLSLKTREYPDFLFTLFGGLTPTENSPDASGNVSTLTNKQGTSIMNATTGVTGVQVITGSENDLKFGKYVLKAITTTTLQLYLSTDADFGRGTAGSYQADDLSLLAAAATVTTGAISNFTGYGLKVTGGSGAIAFTAGDTATFEVRPKNTANMVGVLGAVGANFPEFGAICMAKKKGTGELFEVDCFKCKGEGVPLHFEENKFSEVDVKVTLMYDPAQDGVARLRRVTPTTAN